MINNIEHINSYPKNWILVEEYDGNYIFENLNKTFCINIDYISNCKYPYSISFLQLKEQKIKIGFENGAYVSHSKLLSDAHLKAKEMMEFINSKNEDSYYYSI